MQLKLFATAIAAFSAMSPVLAITSDLLGISINTQTTATIDATQTVKSLKLDSTIDKISFTLDVVQNIVTGAQALAFTAAQQLIKNPTQVFEPQGQLSICANYKALINAQEDFVDSLGDAYETVGRIPYGLTTLLLLRALDLYTGAFARSLTKLVPTCSPGFLDDVERLHGAFGLAISTYSGASAGGS